MLGQLTYRSHNDDKIVMCPLFLDSALRPESDRNGQGCDENEDDANSEKLRFSVLVPISMLVLIRGCGFVHNACEAGSCPKYSIRFSDGEHSVYLYYMVFHRVSGFSNARTGGKGGGGGEVEGKRGRADRGRVEGR